MNGLFSLPGFRSFWFYQFWWPLLISHSDSVCNGENHGLDSTILSLGCDYVIVIVILWCFFFWWQTELTIALSTVRWAAVLSLALLFAVWKTDFRVIRSLSMTLVQVVLGQPCFLSSPPKACLLQSTALQWSSSSGTPAPHQKKLRDLTCLQCLVPLHLINHSS